MFTIVINVNVIFSWREKPNYTHDSKLYILCMCTNEGTNHFLFFSLLSYNAKKFLI